jgi:hypothetical protein
MESNDVFQSITIGFEPSELSAAMFEAACNTSGGVHDDALNASIPVNSERLYGCDTQGYCVIA